MKKLIAGISVALFAASPLAMAQDGDSASYDEELQAGGAAGVDQAEVWTYAGIAALSAGALAGAAFWVQDSNGSGDKSVGGTTGTTGTGGTGASSTGGTQ